jgi:TonB family protein
MYICIAKTNEQTHSYAMNYPIICFPKICRSACALFMFFTCAAVSAGNVAGIASAPGVGLAAAHIAAGGEVGDDVVPMKQVDVKPEFPGGREAMSEYAEKYFAGDSITDKPKSPFFVNVRFIVEKDGSITGAQLKEHYSEKIDNAVLGMLASMPQWTPGQKDGEAVRTDYSTRVSVPEYLAETYTAPEFIGGPDVLVKYFSVELKKRGGSKYRGKRVRVLAQFVVDTDGSIVDVRIVKSGRAYLDKMVYDMLRSMPKWKPGEINGKAVKVRYTLPVSFGYR